MKRLIAVLCVLLAALMVFSLTACKDTKKNPDDTKTTDKGNESKPSEGGDTTPAFVDNSIKQPIKVAGGGEKDTSAVIVTPDYTLIDKEQPAEGDDSWDSYKLALGEYYKYMLAANAQLDVSSRYVLQAIAEAKMLESGTMLPTTTRGGNYAISRVCPRCVSSSLFGTDSDRCYKLLVATDFIKKADRDELNKIYKEVKGTGAYLTKAKEYLESKGYTLKDTYSQAYSSEPQTWDILATYRAADSEAIVNTYDALIEYDNEGRIIGALATSYEVSADGKTYTFHLREGVKWVTSSGEEYADLTANDFVAGLKHLLDKKAGLESLIYGVVKNAEEYCDGTVTDFAQVGVKAVDDLTLVYTLATPAPYFLSMMTYNIFCPMNQEYFESQGDDYGTSPDNILYCGPYLVTNHTQNNKIVFSQNEKYYAKDDMNIKTITWVYNDGKDVTKAYKDAKEGTVDGAGLNTTTLEMAKSDGLYEPNAYVSSTDATTYVGFVNIQRAAYETINGFGMESPKTAEQKEATKKALLNQNFRLALLHAYNKAKDNEIQVGKDLALASLRNSYTPGNFVAIERDVTVDINGTATTFKAGTYYGEIMQAQITADGFKMKVWDPALDDGLGSSDGFDGWYNPTAAVEYLNKAITELAVQGVTISAENPIYIDYPYYETEIRTARAQSVKQSIESALGGKVIVNIIGTADVYGLYYAGYYCDSGKECNYDLYDLSGWGPDYGDPATYLNTMKPFFKGDMTHCLGVY